MTANDYRLVSHWTVTGSEAEVFEILSDSLSLPRWWGSVYMSAETVDSEGTDEAAPAGGRTIAVHARGWLPYSLRLRFRETERHAPGGYSLTVGGDLNGTGVWAFRQMGEDVAITFEWTVRADKPFVRWFSPLLKPLFASNHHWTMRRGEESLRLELLRRRAQSDEERQQILDPPRPFNPYRGLALVTGVALMTGLAATSLRLRRRGS